jgi:hypothetical protein
MSIRFDDKGKFFTDVVSKDTIPVIIQTVNHQIKGMLHVRPNERLTDELNHGELFFAVTEASIYDLTGELIFNCDYFAVNRDQIIWILPENQMVSVDTGGEA